QGGRSTFSTESDHEFIAENLPLFWPRSLKKQDWPMEASAFEDSSKRQVRRGARCNSELSLAVPAMSLSSALTSLEKRGRRWSIINPHSTKKMVYDGFAIVCMAWDFILIPIVIGWDIQTNEHDFLASAMMAVTMFWTLDILVSFRTAYQ
ncbi:unnamed protein product, partial [Prorocentrum cordatum]